MNTYPNNVQNSTTTVSLGASQDIMKKLPWSLALAAIPFIPDILETIRSIPDQMAKNGYGLYVKHGETEIRYKRYDIIDDIEEEGVIDEPNV